MNKTRNISLTVVTTLSLVVLPQVWSTDQDLFGRAPVAPSSLTLVASDDPAHHDADALPLWPAAMKPEIASARWTDIKDNTFERRGLFFVGLERLEARADHQIRELRIKRSALEGVVETGSWDFAMKEMENARDFLRSMANEARTADQDNWDQIKQKIGYAWERTQDAYGKVKGSTTI